MAYITNTVFNRLVMDIDPESDLNFDIDKLFEGFLESKRLLKLFNSLDLKRLHSIKYLLENDSYENIKVLKFVEPQKDDFRFVNAKGGNLKYHLFKDCQVLTKDFLDYKVPFDINGFTNEHAKKLVDSFRQWFTINKYSELIDKKGIEGNQIVVFHYNTYFSKKYNLPFLRQNFIFKETYSNRGYTRVDDSFSLESFTKTIRELLDQRELICNSLTMQHLAKFDFLPQKTEMEIRQYLSKYYNEKLLSSSFIDNYGYERLLNFWKTHLK
ncbi:hypothetical protein [Chryseobacterium aureum]|uniref:hypothetical protein n=1 Tax=Chryseobacterium aureum TaxID=2497456 RepID=UPI000F86D5AE|nr:hypothetical protein [Chryseobacterium aureum]